MAEFLSERWIADLDDAVRSASDLATDEPLVVEQTVRGPDGTDVRYQVRFASDGASVTRGGAGPADLVLVTDRATAWALHQGTQRAQDAFARGALKLRGRPEVLAGRSALLARLDHALAPVRAVTTLGDRGKR